GETTGESSPGPRTLSGSTSSGPGIGISLVGAASASRPDSPGSGSPEPFSPPLLMATPAKGSGCFVAGARLQDAVDQTLRDLYGVERGALAQVVRHDPDRQAVRHGRVAANTADEHVALA